MQISTSVWALARISEVLWPCFFWGPISAIRKVVGRFFSFGGGGEAASQVSENATQNLFSSRSQEVELCHVEVLMNGLLHL